MFSSCSLVTKLLECICLSSRFQRFLHFFGAFLSSKAAFTHSNLDLFETSMFDFINSSANVCTTLHFTILLACLSGNLWWKEASPTAHFTSPRLLDSHFVAPCISEMVVFLLNSWNTSWLCEWILVCLRVYFPNNKTEFWRVEVLTTNLSDNFFNAIWTCQFQKVITLFNES